MGSENSRLQQNNGSERNRRYDNKSSKKVTRRMSMDVGLSITKPPSIRIGGSTGYLPADENSEDNEHSPAENADQQHLDQCRLSLSTDQLTDQRSRSGSSNSQSSLSKQPKSGHSSLSLKHKQLIQSCFNNPHENIGFRILKRSAERRKDFGRFYVAISAEQRDQIAETLKILLKKSVACIENNLAEKLTTLATEFGQKFVDYRLHGFKADYFAVLADSTITECVLLDAAVHPAAVTLNAFSQFITMLFSAVRDGFYNEMRRLRKMSNSFSLASNEAISVRKKLSVDDQTKSPNGFVKSSRSSRSANASPRSMSPSARDKNANSSHSTQGIQEEMVNLEIMEENDKITQKSGSRKEDSRHKSNSSAAATDNGTTGRRPVKKVEERSAQMRVDLLTAALGKENQQQQQQQLIKQQQPKRPQQRQKLLAAN